MAEIALLGAGSWGTALALHLSGIGHAPRLLFRSPAAATQARASGSNATYLPGHALPEGIRLLENPEEALAGAQLVLVTTPVKGLDLAVEWLRGRVPAGAPVVSCAKGIRPDTLETPLGALARALPTIAPRLAVLSGPTFAVELARGDPTAAVVAAGEAGVARQVQAMLSGGRFRIYANDDPIGVEWAGALKNVVAIAAGVADGLGWGMNTTAALITRGLAEMTRMGVAEGGRASTFAGLAGLGDLVLTCAGRWSRNRAVGRDLALGRALPEIIDGSPMVAEGVLTAAAARARAQQSGIEMPIINEVAALLFDGRLPATALAALLARDLKDEERYHGEGGGMTGA